MGTSRPTAITPVGCAAITHPQNSHAHCLWRLATPGGARPTAMPHAWCAASIRGEIYEKKSPREARALFAEGLRESLDDFDRSAGSLDSGLRLFGDGIRLHLEVLCGQLAVGENLEAALFERLDKTH